MIIQQKHARFDITDGISNSASSGSLRSNTQDCEGILPNKGWSRHTLLIVLIGTSDWSPHQSKIVQ